MPNRRVFEGKNLELLRRMLSNGRTYKDIAEVSCCSPQTVSVYAREMGIQRKAGRAPWDPRERFEELEKLLSEGANLYEVAYAMGVSVRTMQRYIARTPGIILKRRQNGASRNLDWTLAKELLSAGKSYREVAFELNCSPSSIAYIARKSGIRKST